MDAESKWPRIWIAAAGMYVEVVLAAVCVFVWWNTREGVLHHVSLNVFFVSTVTTVIFNANPLLRFDGYYMLADLLEIPNLRPKASRLLQRWFAWCCLGIELRRDPFEPTSAVGRFILFAIASAIYRWVVLFGIAWFLYTVLKPYRLESIGILLAAGSIGTVVLQSGYGVYKILTMPRREPFSRIKLFVTLSALAVVLAGVCVVPFPWVVEAPFTTQPAGVVHVYAQVPGTLLRAHVREGAVVSAGDLLLTLSNFELEERQRHLEVAVQRLAPEIEHYRQAGERDLQRVAQERVDSLRAQQLEVASELEKLRVVAPISGRIVAAPEVVRRERPGLEEQLPGWSGTPLDPANEGADVTQSTQLLSIAPSDRFEAVLLIDQADRGEAEVGQSVRLQLEHLPGTVLTGTIATIADRHAEYASSALSNKYGGPLATITDSDGRERLASLAYQATVTLPSADSLAMRTGLRGNARVVVDNRSLANWLHRWLRTTFKFRL
ncbi:MAG: HlyD family efflux transporter periplasmic adaptor subunit [Planctomycetaceae bacterium]